MSADAQAREGILLKKTPYGDCDFVLLFLTDRGTDTYFAKAARRSRKRFAGQLDFFRRLRLRSRIKREGAWNELTSCDLLEVWEPLWQDPERYPIACRWIDLARHLLPAGKGASVYPFICESLRYLACHAASRELAVRFELSLSMRLGYGPNFEAASVPGLAAGTLAWLAAYHQEMRKAHGKAPGPLDAAGLLQVETLLAHHWQVIQK